MKGWRCPVDGPVQKSLVCVPKIRGQQQEPAPPEEEPAPRPAIKRPIAEVPAAESAAPPKKREVEPSVMVFASKAEAEAQKEIKTLLGEYTSNVLFNHGKRTFLKEDADGSSLWLYFWDNRDGPDFSGWWIGDKVGGATVYARAKEFGAAPPVKGWRVPHDANVDDDLTMVMRGREEVLEMTEADRLDKANELVRNAEASAEKAIKTAQLVLGGEGDLLEEGLRAVFDLLQTQVEALEEAMASLDRHARAAKKQKASTEVDAELNLLKERVGAVSVRTKTELDAAQEKLEKLERGLAEERDAASVEEALPLAMEAVTQAEMAADAATSEQGATRARNLVENALAMVEKTLDASRSFAPDAQKVAMTEFKALQRRCEEAGSRLALWDGSGLFAEKAGAKSAPSTASKKAGKADDIGPVVSLLAAGKPEAEVLAGLNTQVSEVETKAKSALEAAHGAGADGVALLEELSLAVAKAQKTLACEVAASEKRKKVKAATTEAMAALKPRLDVVQSRIDNELAHGKRSAAKERLRKKEGEEADAADKTLPAALEAVVLAEAGVDVAAAEAGDLEWRRTQMASGVEFSDEYGQDVRKAMDEMQGAAARAQEAINDARAAVDAQIRVVRALPVDQQKAAFADTAPLRKRLVDAQKRLNPYKQLRGEYEQKLKGKLELEDVGNEVSSLEADVHKLTVALNSPMSSEEEVEGAESALHQALVGLSKVLKLLEVKSRNVVGSLRERLVAIQLRVRDAQKRTEALRLKVRDQRHGLVARVLVDKATADVEKSEEWLKKMAEAEAPWSDGSEVLPESVAAPALVACDAIVAEAEPEVKLHKAFIQERLLEVRHLPEGTCRLETAEQVQALQSRVDTVALKVTQLKVDTAARKIKMQLPDVITAVAKAEEEVRKMSAVAKFFSEDNLETLDPKKFKAEAGKVDKFEKAAAEVCAASRKVLEAKQKELNVRTSPSMATQLNRLDERLRAAETECSNLRTAAASGEKNKQILEKLKAEAKRLDDVVAEAELLALPLGDEVPGADSEDSTAQAFVKATDEVDKWLTAAKVYKSDPHGAMRIAMGRVLEEGAKLQARLAETKVSLGSKLERGSCRLFVKEGAEMLKAADKAVASLEAADDSKAAAAGEEAAKVVGEADAWLQAKSAEASTFTGLDDACRRQVASLKQMASRAKLAAAKVSQYKANPSTLKRAASAASAAPAAAEEPAPAPKAKSKRTKK